MSNTCKCLFLPDASIYLLSTYGNNAINQGYNVSYGSNYGGATANAFDGFKTGQFLGNAKAKLNIEFKTIGGLVGKNISDSGCGGSYPVSASIAVDTTCWSTSTLTKFLGANIVETGSSLVSKIIPAGVIPTDFAILEDGIISNALLINVATSATLINGMDYYVDTNAIVFVKSIVATSGLAVSYSVTGKQTIRLFANNANAYHSLKIVGKNHEDGKAVSVILPKVKHIQGNLDLDFIGADDYINIPLNFKAYKGVVDGLTTEPDFLIINRSI
jgi:hypothetical protein